MARSLEFSNLLRFRPTWTEPLDLVDVVDSSDLSYRQTLTTGTGSQEADAYYRDVITLAASATTTLDLSDLTLQFYGGTGSLTIYAVKVLLIRMASGGGANVSLGTSVTGAVRSSDILYATNLGGGWVESSLTLQNAFGASCDVEVHILGTTAPDSPGGSFG